MLTCIACSKQQQLNNDNTGSLPQPDEDGDPTPAPTPSTKQAIKALTVQIKDMALKTCGKPCSGGASHHHHPNYADSEAFHCSYKRTASSNSLKDRLKVLSSGESTPVSVSGRSESVVGVDDDEPKEWVAQVEPGVLITFVSLHGGGNDLKRIRFSREMFNKWQAQRWWSENYDKLMELYNVRKFNRQTVPLPTPPRSEDENLKLEYPESSPVTPPLTKERLPSNFHRPTGVGHLSSGSLDRDPLHSHHYYDTTGLNSTPKLSSISATKSETPSLDASARTSSSREGDRSGELSVSNASDVETEWVEEDEPGVYITIRALPGGTRELRRVRFSRERFGEMHARLWWEENRARIQAQYL